MLKHSIVKYKEPEEPYSYWNTRRGPSITTQEEYDAFLKTALPIGKFVCFAVHGQGNINTKWMINYVIDIERDLKKIKFSTQGQPESHLLVQLGDLEPSHAWCRWVAPTEYRELDEAVERNFIDDHVRNYFKNFTAEQARQRCRVF